MKSLRKFIDFISLLLGKLKSKRKISINNQQVVKVNLGCGLAVAPGWINIDGSLNSMVANLPSMFHKASYYFSGAKNYYSQQEYCRILGENIFIHHDISHGIPLNSESADFVYSSHFLEHLYPKDARNLLTDCYRVLKRGGCIRISVPDLEYAIRLYDKGETEKMLDHYFFIDDRSYYAQHKYMYDFRLLSSILKNIGFQTIQKSYYRKGNFPDIAILDNREEESLFIEAYR